MQMEMEAVPMVETKPTRKIPTSTGSDAKDPTNAAHVTPSVLAQHIGQPTVLHDDANARHAERHGSLSHQETHI
jgi:hypothetical protein